MAGKKIASTLLRGLGSASGQKLLRGALGSAAGAAHELYRLAGNRRVRLAVTGLSRSGKSVFITALVDQLLNASGGRDHRLPRLRAVEQGRFLAAREAPQPDSTVPTFRFHEYRQLLAATPPNWPAGTVDISQLRLHLRSRPDGALASMLSEYQELFLDITDYPGEWLVDLPMLEQTFEQWSQQIWRQSEQPHLAPLSAPWRDYMRSLDRAAAAPRDTLERASTLFRDYLLAAKSAGFNFLQPGRIVLPGALAGSPAVSFCACPAPAAAAAPDSLYRRFDERFSQYQRDVVKPFYRRHFASFDRQVVLVDLMHALQQGPAHFADATQTLNTLLRSFNHGRSGVLRRLFTPKIDRILFAATKVDQVNREQYANLQRLLQTMLGDTQRSADFNNARTLCLALAAVKATATVVEPHGGGEREFVRGRLASQPFDAPEQELYYPPGAVPASLPDETSWREQPFSFYEFHPPPPGPVGQALPHVNMDAALEFLLGDKL